MTGNLPSAIDLAAALRDGRATVTAPESVSYDAGDCVNSGAAWPAFDLVIEIDGQHALTVPVWCCATWDERERWAISGDDGEHKGFRRPRVVESDDDHYVVAIYGGDNLAGRVCTLDAGADKAAAEAAAEIVGDALARAYEAVEVDEPSADDLDDSDVPPWGWTDLSTALGIRIGVALHPIIRGGAAEDDRYNDGAPGVAWLVRGLPALDDQRYDNRATAESAAREMLPEVIADLNGLRSVVVAVQDSLDAGNCRAETERAAALIRGRRNLADDDEITAEDVLSVLDAPAARAACACAALRQ